MRESNRYAFQNNLDLNITAEEMKCVLGVLILSGYLSLPRRMFWENSADTHHSLVTNTMRRDIFEAIFTHLHLADNTQLDKGDKFTKVRPLLQYLGKSFCSMPHWKNSIVLMNTCVNILANMVVSSSVV